MLDKIRELVAVRERMGLDFLIEIDGGCNEKTYRQLYEAGADVLIVGSSGLFNLDKNLPAAWDKMMELYRHAIEA